MGNWKIPTLRQIDLLKKQSAKEVFVKLAYAIGYDKPIQASAVIDGEIVPFLKGYDLSPNGIIDLLDLKKPNFSKTAEWGHMGNNFKWL